MGIARVQNFIAFVNINGYNTAIKKTQLKRKVMNRTVTVRAMIDPERKEKVSAILSRLGLNHSEAINIFYSLVEEYKGLPFELKLPSEDVGDKTIRPEVISHLKTSLKKNHRLGELLAQ